MLTTEAILEMWKKDSIIDDTKLDQVTIDKARMHAKYLEMFQLTKRNIKKVEKDLKKLKFDKTLWYSGRMTREEMDARGWRYDPLGGLKVMKSDVQNYVEVDPDVVRSQEGLDELMNTFETLEEIMGAIRWRHSDIRNVLDYKKFTAGC